MATKQQQTIYDLAIVGGGLAGAAQALAAARMGLRVVIVEAHAVDSFPDAQPERVIALSHGSRAHLGSLGVWEGVAAAGVAPIRKVHICEPGNDGEVHMHQAEADIEALGYVVQNAHILRAIYAALPQEVDVLAPAALESVDVLDDGVGLHIRIDDDEQLIACHLLVGADGTMSRVRRVLGIGSRGWDHNRFGLVASVRPNIAHHDVAHECFRADGPLAFLPLDTERYSLVWTLAPCDASRIMALDDATFLHELEMAAGRDMQALLGGFSDTGPRALFPFEYRVCERFTVPRCVLIGNAAHTMHPVAGQGLNLGLRDVATLTTALQRAVDAGRDIAAPVVLEEYAQQRCADTAAVSVFTEGLNAVFCTDLLPVKLARGAGMSVMNRMPPLRRWLLKRASGVAQLKGEAT